MLNRREFHRRALGAGAGLAALPALTQASGVKPRGKAEACIFLWLGGGMCHIDTFDPKRLGDPKERKAGSAYPAIDTAIPGVQVCEHLPRTASLLDRGVVIRSVTHHLTNEHAAPTNLFKTGRIASGNLVYPSIGSVVSHQRGPRVPGLPPYVVMGYPNVTRGPGFLGSQYSYIYLTDTCAGPAGLRRPVDVSDERFARRTDLLGKLRDRYLDRQADPAPRDYDATITEAFRLTSGDFAKVFELDREPADLRQRYGDEFGQRCLLARRLVEAGTRFVEVSFNLNFINGTGWDTHREGQLEQHRLIQSFDQSLTALIEDLQRTKLFDDTLVVVATEFGRPPEFDGGGGRGHHSACFSTAFFGGGLKLGQVIGTTDEMGNKVVERPISLADWHATFHAAMGIDPNVELYAGDRPVPLTEHGNPIAELFA